MKTWIVIGVFLLSGCRLTDHGENASEISSDLINVPTSGYHEADPEKMPEFRFDEQEIDAGEISQGSTITERFKFTNSGGSPLLISDVRSTCGCTVSKNWPKEPIAPGDGGEIEVTFDSEGKSGLQNKPVTIVANTSPETTVLTLKVEVKAPTTNQD